MPDDMLMPDVVIKSIMRATRRADIAQRAYTNNKLLLDQDDPLTHPLSQRCDVTQTKNLVQAALSAFSEPVAEKIARILSLPSLIVQQEGPSGAWCYNATETRPLGQIYLSRDLTLNDPIYLGHEAGHMMANHFALEETREYWESMAPKNIAEIPAFVTQFMMYDYLCHRPDMALDCTRHFINDVCHMVYEHQIASSPCDVHFPELEAKEERSYQQSKASLHVHSSQMIIAAGLYYSNAIKEPGVFDAVFKSGAKTDILKILEAADITNATQLDDFCDVAVAKCLAPLLSVPPMRPQQDVICTPH